MLNVLLRLPFQPPGSLAELDTGTGYVEPIHVGNNIVVEKTLQARLQVYPKLDQNHTCTEFNHLGENHCCRSNKALGICTMCRRLVYLSIPSFHGYTTPLLEQRAPCSMYVP